MKKRVFVFFLSVLGGVCAAQSADEMVIYSYTEISQAITSVLTVEFYPDGMIKKICKSINWHEKHDPPQQVNELKDLRPYSVTEVVRDGVRIAVYEQKEGETKRIAAFELTGPDSISVIWGDEKLAGKITLDDPEGSFTYYTPEGKKKKWLVRGEDEMVLYDVRGSRNEFLVPHTFSFGAAHTITGAISDFGDHPLTTAVAYEDRNRLSFVTKENPEKERDFWYRTDMVLPRIQFSRLSRVLNYFIPKDYVSDFSMPAFITTLLPAPVSPQATGTLEDPGIPGRYGAGKAFDGDPLTAWVEGRPGPGVGERVGFVSEEPIKADEIRVAPGYFDAEWWAANNRVRKALLHFDDRTVEADFKDAREVQAVPLGEVLEFSRFDLEIVETWPHSRYDDTPVAEIELYYEGERVHLKTSF
jgi:hypothetical protein